MLSGSLKLHKHKNTLELLQLPKLYTMTSPTCTNLVGEPGIRVDLKEVALVINHRRPAPTVAVIPHLTITLSSELESTNSGAGQMLMVGCGGVEVAAFIKLLHELRFHTL